MSVTWPLLNFLHVEHPLANNLILKIFPFLRSIHCMKQIVENLKTTVLVHLVQSVQQSI